ncbi:MAG: signal peptidase I [Planctomycetes bacterium]|nr:signal peptidase I [Planctomycetota bacterium]
MSTVLLLLFFLVVNFLLVVVSLWLAGRWLKAKGATLARATAATLTIWLVNVVALVVLNRIEIRLRPEKLVVVLAVAAGVIIVQILVYAKIVEWILRTTLPRAVLAWLISMIPGALALALVFFVIKPHVVEAFVIPTNSMAPTLIGWHQIGVCPHCGKAMIVPSAPPDDPARDFFREREPLGICEHCLQAGQARDVSAKVENPDRMICNKLLTPRRWDLIVFRYPRNPELKYVARLVAFPGEEIAIKDGAVWINQVKQEPPEAIAGLRFETEAGGMPAGFATAEQPLRLQDGEHFVLGDFSLNSSDSRDWGPVPAANIEGVASVRYWPPSRWRIWR